MTVLKTTVPEAATEALRSLCGTDHMNGRPVPRDTEPTIDKNSILRKKAEELICRALEKGLYWKFSPKITQ